MELQEGVELVVMEEHLKDGFDMIGKSFVGENEKELWHNDSIEHV